MKKISLMLLTVLFTICLVSCDPSHFHYAEEDFEQMVSAELIYYDNPNPKELFEKRDKTIPFDFGKMTVIAKLDEEKMDEMKDWLSKMQILMVWRHYDSPVGYCIRIINADGSFEIVNPIHVSRFYEDGSVRFFIGEIGYGEYDEMIKLFGIE